MKIVGIIGAFCLICFFFYDNRPQYDGVYMPCKQVQKEIEWDSAKARIIRGEVPADSVTIIIQRINAHSIPNTK